MQKSGEFASESARVIFSIPLELGQVMVRAIMGNFVSYEVLVSWFNELRFFDFHDICVNWHSVLVIKICFLIYFVFLEILKMGRSGRAYIAVVAGTGDTSDHSSWGWFLELLTMH